MQTTLSGPILRSSSVVVSPAKSGMGRRYAHLHTLRAYRAPMAAVSDPRSESGRLQVSPAPLLPDYGGACISSVVPALLGTRRDWPWLPDGLGWEQLRERTALAPFLTSMAGGAITSVAPTTTATALTSITTGLTPAEHELVGYRVRVGSDVLNVLRWRTAAGDA